MSSIHHAKVVISGASSGIGRSIALALSKYDTELFLLGRNKDKLLETVKLCSVNKGVKVYYYLGDLGVESTARMIIEEIKKVFITPDIIINNAGGGSFKNIRDCTISSAEEAMRVPYFAYFYLTQGFINDLLKNGHGHIVNINTPAAYFPFPNTLTYSATRAAIRSFTRCLRLDLKGTPIKITEIVPGLTETDYFDNNGMSWNSQIPKLNRFLFKVLSPDVVAEKTVLGILKNKKTVTPQKMMRLLLVLSQYFPNLFDKLMSY
ncbi:MAG: SDR family NAD(P)-dependent oxidoreductase [Phycisphaerales bacterium]|nr:SDR family NAD(P)-dependent oxidoreductase [Phycisphaerales bacterium]